MVVYLIGAGPGDADLITLKAVKALNKADVVLYDYLANEEILAHAPDTAERIYVGKKAGEHYKTQDEINELIIEQAQNHENVVRLKGGDPFVFGRGGEEILALMEHDIKFVVIPGVTSAIGAPTSLGLPVTHRAVATSVTIVTGHEDPTKPESQVHWDYTADTLIILMGIGNIKENTAEIMKYRSADTPVCAVESGTLPNQNLVFGTLGDIADKKINTPAILIIGDVVNMYKEIFENKIHIKKDKGKIAEVDKKLDLTDMPGNFGIAHVRWATHGDPSKLNSHPHIDEDTTVAVVHNGIIENYLEIKEKLILEGHVFKSDTDTEVIPHLIQKFMDEKFDLEHAVRKTIDIIEGAYAIAAISINEPDKIVATRKDSPLIVGIGDEGYYLASDSPAILKYARDIIYPERGEIVILDKDGVVVHDEFDNVVNKEIDTINWTPEMAEKEGYEHFMIKEINEQAIAVRNTLTQKDNIQEIIDEVGDVQRICFVACGTSYHASLTGKYLIESLAGIPTDVILASEFKYSANTLDDKTLVIFISQSGETADSLKALDVANQTSITLGIVNVAGSSITRRAKYVIQTQAGPEIGVAATKTYVAQLTAIYLLAALISKNVELLKELDNVPDFIDEALENVELVEELSRRYNYARDFFYLGRGYSYPTALEGALKLKEITYIHGEGYAAGELKHGPLALIDEGIPVVVVIPPGDNYRKTMSNLEEVKSRGANVLAIGSDDDESLKAKADAVIAINSEVKEIIAPLVYIVPLQLIAYYITLEKGHDPDKPKNLAKCVTVE